MKKRGTIIEHENEDKFEEENKTIDKKSKNKKIFSSFPKNYEQNEEDKNQ